MAAKKKTVEDPIKEITELDETTFDTLATQLLNGGGELKGNIILYLKLLYKSGWNRRADYRKKK